MDRDVTRKILYGLSIYYFVGDRPVHKLQFGPKRHELFVILYSIPANLSDGIFFCYCISKAKHEFGQNPEEIIIFTGHGQYTVILTGSLINTNRENMNVKNNIYIHIEFGSVKRYKALGLCDSICNTLSVLSYHSLV